MDQVATYKAFHALANSCSIPNGQIEVFEGPCRGLACAKPCKKGDVIFSLPWSKALVPRNVVGRLRRDERRKQGLLPGGIDKLLQQLRRNSVPGVSRENAWILLLAIHILQEFRDPRSPWLNYVKLLPTPAGTLMSHIASFGSESTDLLFFSEKELNELQYENLESDVREEKTRLKRLYEHLFKQDCENPTISLESFMWAHCLVRSRSLDLTGYIQENGERAFRARCLLPVIDLCNHGGKNSNIHLSVRLNNAGSPSQINVSAVKDLSAHEQLLLDYGDRSLKDFMQGYYFTPNDHFKEEFQDFGGGWECLHVRANSGTGPLWLKNIYLLPAEENSMDSSTELDTKEDSKPGQTCKKRQILGQSLLYVIREACPEGLENQGSAVRVSLPGRTYYGTTDSSIKVRQCDPEIEAGLASYLANGLEEMTSKKSTSSSQDAALLNILEQKGHTMEIEEQDSDECDVRTRSRGKSDFESRNCMLAVLEYRLTRKRLAHKIAQDLRMQAEFLKQSGQETLK